MNLRKFMQAFDDLGSEYSWELNEWGGLRATYPDVDSPMCPIEAVLHSRTGTHAYYVSSATRLGLKGKDRHRIVEAADNRQKGSTERRLREEMLMSKIQPLKS